MTRLVVALLAVASLVTPAAAQTSGQWTSMAPLPFFPTAMHVLPSGKVMFYGGDAQGTPPGPPATSIMSWDPASGQTRALAPPGYDLFCAGHSYLADGKLLLTGGHVLNFVGLANASTYDPITDRWAVVPNMNAGRWYPTNTTLPNGDVLVTSGQIDTSRGVDALPQVFSAATRTWRNLTNAQLALDLYPRMHLAPNGKVFNSGPTGTTRYLDTTGTGTWSFVATRGGGNRDYGSSVMYDTGKILFVGGGDPPTAIAEVIDLTAPAPAWRRVGSMAAARRHHNATLLPDGKVLVTGGTRGSGFNNTGTPVFAAELWDPITERFTAMASQKIGRFYHSVSLLLPDGRVMSAGGNGHPEVEVFSPPYLFAGTRPTITSAPASVAYGQAFSVPTPDAASISSVTWIRLPSVTHAFDQNQIINRLTFTRASGALNVAAPTNRNLTPPGHYMLFVLNAQGVPSVARIVQIGGTTGGTPPPPSGPTLTSLSPASVPAGGAALTLTVNGSNFVAGSTVLWNGAARSTTVVSGTRLTAAISAADIATAGSATVAVTNPASGGTSNALTFVIAGGGLQVWVTQPAPGGSISGAAFWATVWVNGASGTSNAVSATLGGRAAGSTTSSSAGPISLTLNTTVVGDGTHTLVISARDAAGKTGTTSVPVVTRNGIAGVPGPAPLTAAIASPAAGATVKGTTTVTMSATGGTSPYTYGLVADSASVPTSGNTASWNTTGVADGSHTLRATVKDAAGTTATTTTSVIVANQSAPPPPATGTLQVSITQPAPGATVSGTQWVTLWVDGASGTSNVYTISSGGQVMDTVTNSSRGPVTLAWETGRVGDGAQTLTASVKDATGNTGATTISVTVKNGTTTPPPPPPSSGALQLHLTQPPAGATVRGTVWVTLWLDGASPGTNTYTLTVNGTVVATQATSSTGPVSLPWVTSAADNGPRTISAGVRDASGKTGTSAVSVTVGN